MEKVLVVDDMDLDRKLIMTLLKKMEATNEFLEARNGEEAIKIIGANYKDIGLILLDLQIPVISGLELMEGFSKVAHIADIPVIVISVSGDNSSREKVKKVCKNLAVYIVKPFSSEEFMKIIAPYLMIEAEK